MFGLPQGTELNKNIPKLAFYEDFPLTIALKRAFSEQIETICWRNRINQDTAGLKPGPKVKELEIFEIRLNQQKFDQNILQQIDREIFEHILFLLEYEGKYQAWMSKRKKEEDSRLAALYVHTRWMEPDKLPILLSGQNLDQAYENFIRQITGNTPKSLNVKSLKKAIMHGEKRD